MTRPKPAMPDHASLRDKLGQIEGLLKEVVTGYKAEGGALSSKIDNLRRLHTQKVINTEFKILEVNRMKKERDALKNQLASAVEEQKRQYRFSKAHLYLFGTENKDQTAVNTSDFDSDLDVIEVRKPILVDLTNPSADELVPKPPTASKKKQGSKKRSRDSSDTESLVTKKTKKQKTSKTEKSHKKPKSQTNTTPKFNLKQTNAIEPDCLIVNNDRPQTPLFVKDWDGPTPPIKQENFPVLGEIILISKPATTALNSPSITSVQPEALQTVSKQSEVPRKSVPHSKAANITTLEQLKDLPESAPRPPDIVSRSLPRPPEAYIETETCHSKASRPSATEPHDAAGTSQPRPEVLLNPASAQAQTPLTSASTQSRTPGASRPSQPEIPPTPVSRGVEFRNLSVPSPPNVPAIPHSRQSEVTQTPVYKQTGIPLTPASMKPTASLASLLRGPLTPRATGCVDAYFSPAESFPWSSTLRQKTSVPPVIAPPDLVSATASRPDEVYPITRRPVIYFPKSNVSPTNPAGAFTAVNKQPPRVGKNGLSLTTPPARW